MTTQLEPLERYRGRNRVVLVFAPSRTDEGYLEQKKLFEASEDGLRERDLLVFYLSDEAVGTKTPTERFNIPKGAFALILIGKDGGEKERFLEPVEPATLFGVIDQMPIRRREMRGSQ